MAQIPTSSITMAQIKAETGASATGTLDQCRVASNAYTMTSTSVPGHTRDGTEQTNTNAANWNNTMAEWAGYTHTQDLATPTYYVRTGTTISSKCVTSRLAIIAGEGQVSANTIFYMKLNGMTLEFYLDSDHTLNYYPQNSYSQTSFSRTSNYYNTSGTAVAFTGSWANGWNPVKIAELDVEDPDSAGNVVAGLQAKISGTVFSSIGVYNGNVNEGVTTVGVGTPGYTLGNVAGNSDQTTDFRTPHASNLFGISPSAWTMPIACFDYDSHDSYHRIEIQVKATGYNTLTLTNFSTEHTVYMLSDDCE